MNTGKSIFPLFILFISSSCFGSLTSYPGPAASSIRQEFPALARYSDEWELFSDWPRFTAAVGSFIFYPLVYLLGRQLSISVAAFANGVMYLLILAANEDLMTYLVVVRMLHGLIWGLLSSLTLIYLFEMAPPSHFGFTGCMHQFFNVLGICLNNLLAAFVNFRILSIVCAIISFVFGGLVWIICDSPGTAFDRNRRLAKKAHRQNLKLNRKNKMLKELDNNSDDPENKDTRRDKEKAKNNDDQINDSYTLLNYSNNDGLFTQKNFPICIKGVLLFLFQQFCGTNAILNNLTSIMAQSGLEINSNLLSLMANIAQLIAVFVVSFLVDFYGPRFFWCLSSAILTLLLILYSLTIYFENAPSYLAALCIFCYRLGFGLGVGPLTYAIWVQLFSDSARVLGTMIMMASHWIISWVVVYTFPIMNSSIGEFYTVIIYACFTFVSVFYGAFFIPDNKEKDTEEMALI